MGRGEIARARISKRGWQCELVRVLYIIHNVVIYASSVTSAQLPYSTKPQRQKAEAVLKYK